MKKSIICICAFLIVSSCSNDFIDLIPKESVTVDVIYKTDKDFSDALTGVYRSIRDQYGKFYVFGDIRADDSEMEFKKSNVESYADAFTLNSNDNLVRDAWQRYYQAIFRANTLLSKIEEIDATKIPNKNRYIGEARFLRAIAYFDLVRIFGAVPAITKPVSVPESYQIPREPVDNIYNTIIIPDFQAAEGFLPTSYTGSNIGRATQGAAKSMLGRVYLTIKDYQKAESKLMEVTSMGYALVANYNALFDYTNKRHSEYIYNIEYEQGINGGSSFTNWFAPNSEAFGRHFGIVGSRDEFNNPSFELMALFEDHDTRKEITVGIYGGFYNNDSVFIALPGSTNQKYTKKYLISEPAQYDSRADWKVIRYGDVLLMLAEAMNENGKTAEAIPYLNMIRKRARVDEYPTTMSKAETFAAIEKERRLELSFEGVRWFDLVRWGKAYEVMKSQGMAEFMTLFPIPLAQVQLINDPAILSQNPGY